MGSTSSFVSFLSIQRILLLTMFLSFAYGRGKDHAVGRRNEVQIVVRRIIITIRR